MTDTLTTNDTAPETKPPTYLGDGVYATFDGYHIWLYTLPESDGSEFRIAIEPDVYEALAGYAKRVWQPGE